MMAITMMMMMMMINPPNVRINHHNVVDILTHLHITICLLHLLIESVLSLGPILPLDLGLLIQVLLVMILVVIIIMDYIHHYHLIIRISHKLDLFLRYHTVSVIMYD